MVPEAAQQVAYSPTRRSGAARVGILGARGYVGGELVRLIGKHPRLNLAFVSSRALAGHPLQEHIPDGASSDLTFCDLDAAGAAQEVREGKVDAVILALPNGLAREYVAAIDEASGKRSAEVVLIDLSADYRFEAAHDRGAPWVYGLPEHFREGIVGARRISNPGCYATAAQVALRPVVSILDGTPSIFGVSGYSGAGTTPSDRNDPEKLRDNLMPYALIGHVHEREITHHLKHEVHFMPHVGAFFRGITLTVNAPIRCGALASNAMAQALYADAYADEPLIAVSAAPPLVRDMAHNCGVAVGGFAVSEDGSRLVVVATIDNLLKGAAAQAIQNLNLALWGRDSELEGIIPE